MGYVGDSTLFKIRWSIRPGFIRALLKIIDRRNMELEERKIAVDILSEIDESKDIEAVQSIPDLLSHILLSTATWIWSLHFDRF